MYIFLPIYSFKEPGELSAPSTNLDTAFKLIKDIQKMFKQREAEEKEKADLVEQDSVNVNLFFVPSSFFVICLCKYTNKTPHNRIGYNSWMCLVVNQTTSPFLCHAGLTG